jgi:hypothetical protein
LLEGVSFAQKKPLCGACPIVGYCGFLNKLLTQKKKTKKVPEYGPGLSCPNWDVGGGMEYFRRASRKQRLLFS